MKAHTYHAQLKVFQPSLKFKNCTVQIHVLQNFRLRTCLAYTLVFSLYFTRVLFSTSAPIYCLSNLFPYFFGPADNNSLLICRRIEACITCPSPPRPSDVM